MPPLPQGSLSPGPGQFAHPQLLRLLPGLLHWAANPREGQAHSGACTKFPLSWKHFRDSRPPMLSGEMRVSLLLL